MESSYVLSGVVPRVLLLVVLSDNAGTLVSRLGLQALQSLRAAVDAIHSDVLRGLPYHQSDLKKLVTLALTTHNASAPATGPSHALALKQRLAQLKAGGSSGHAAVAAALARLARSVDTHLLSLLHAEYSSVGAVVEVLAGSLPSSADDPWTKLLDSLSPKVTGVDQQLGLLAVAMTIVGSLNSRFLNASNTVSRGPPTLVVSVPDRVFFASNRQELLNALGEEGSLEALWYGVAEVSIDVPNDETDFQPTSPENVHLLPPFPEATHSYSAFIENINDHLAELDEQAGSSTPTTDVLIFIHGFAMTFVDAIQRAAQLKNDMKIVGAVIAFSWPSKGRGLPYIEDGVAATASIPFVASFISLCMTEIKARRLHILAHSMGNKVMIGAMRQLYEEIGPAGDGGWMSMGCPLKNIISAAGDEAYTDFQSMLDEAKQVFGAGVDSNDEHRPFFTLYTSLHDMALQASKSIFHNNVNRVGLTDAHFEDGILTMYEPHDIGFVDVIDCTGYPLKSNHMYFATEKDLLRDTHHLISTVGKERAYLRACQDDTNLIMVGYSDSLSGKEFEFFSFSSTNWKNKC